MGWLFAVALGLQEHKRTAVLRALVPIALGHALSIGIIIAVVLLARISLPHSALKYSAAAILFAFGLYRLFRSRHRQLGGDASGFWRFNSLVVYHGIGTWRRIDAHSVISQISRRATSCKSDELTHAFDVEFWIRQRQFAISADWFNRRPYLWLPSGNWLGGDAGL